MLEKLSVDPMGLPPPTAWHWKAATSLASGLRVVLHCHC